MENFKNKFKEFESKIERLKSLEKELNSLDTGGFESEVKQIKSMLKSPDKIPRIEKGIEELKVKIERRAPDISVNRTTGKTSIKEDEELDVTIELKNAGEDSARSVSFSDVFDGGLKIVSGENSWTGEMKKGESKPFKYRIKAVRAGKYTIPRLIVHYRDKQEKTYEKSTYPIEIEVIPKAEAIHPAKVVVGTEVVPDFVQAPRNAYGVIIGIGKYKDSSIPALKYTTNDAREIYNILIDPQYGNFPRENIKLLLDEQATLTEIKSAMGTYLARKAGKDDTVFIYFAGHGSPEIDPTGKADDRLEKFIVPYDAKKDDLFGYGLSMDEIRKIYERIESKKVVFFIDSCYSGEAGGRTFSRPDVTARNVTISDKFLEDLSGEGRIIITACKPDELSLETNELEHGIFTYYLAEGLKGKADLNKDGVVTADELYSYVYEQVTKKARLLGASQHPLKKGTIIGEIPLTRYETEIMRKIKDLHSIAVELVKEGKYEDGIKKYEGELSPAQYELSRRLLKSRSEDLSQNDKKVVKLLYDLLLDQITILTFREDVENIVNNNEFKKR